MSFKGKEGNKEKNEPANYVLSSLKKGVDGIKGGDSAPLLRPHETPPGLLHLAFRSLASKRYGLAGVGPEKSHEDDQEAKASLL